MKNIDSIISIVSLGRSARNRANIKNRQPLQTVYIYIPKQKNITLDDSSKQEILEELNIKDIEFINDVENILSYKVKPNFVALKDRFDSNMKDVISKLNQIKDSDKINMLNDGDINLEIDGSMEKISKDDLIIEEVPIDGVSVSSNNGIVVGINVNISDALEKEGLVRDMIRHIQNFRKRIFS